MRLSPKLTLETIDKTLAELKEAINQYQERKDHFTDLMKYVFFAGAIRIVSNLIEACGSTPEIGDILNVLEEEIKNG